MNINSAKVIDPVLRGKLVELRPLKHEHSPLLLTAAADGELWNMTVTVIPSPSTIQSYIATALDGKVLGTVIPFIIVNLDDGQVVGTTRFWKVDYENKNVEIGHTWLSKSAQRSGINTEAKYLMLTYAFEVMKVIRVQFTTDELNSKSRAAILGIGAIEEGIIRNERIMPNGRKRNSVRFSIIDSEWPEKKLILQKKINA